MHHKALRRGISSLPEVWADGGSKNSNLIVKSQGISHQGPSGQRVPSSVFVNGQFSSCLCHLCFACRPSEWFRFSASWVLPGELEHFCVIFLNGVPTMEENFLLHWTLTQGLAGCQDANVGFLVIGHDTDRGGFRRCAPRIALCQWDAVMKEIQMIQRYRRWSGVSKRFSEFFFVFLRSQIVRLKESLVKAH